jgi:large subunit ribosomal protein L15
MDLSDLKYAEGSRKNRKRVGRGGAHGKTSGRGEKGQLSRSGAKRRRWFEGGQMPLQRRLPKRGFTNFTKVQYQVINVSDLNRLDDTAEVTPEILRAQGLIHTKNQRVKILGNGELKKKLSVSASAFSKSAIEKIEAAGGRTTVV